MFFEATKAYPATLLPAFLSNIRKSKKSGFGSLLWDIWDTEEETP
jgi:hypothetical protein